MRLGYTFRLIRKNSCARSRSGTNLASVSFSLATICTEIVGEGEERKKESEREREREREREKKKRKREREGEGEGERVCVCV